ncbi:MAG: prepilin-type N-terminal cleavage/methylation domain-containing protein [Desulfohalobiaceae bacterium]|nr:prepilin-type N-terminal cleavage/methylation domain-containing protein [Desulfohalobiaceae bacterium]
MAREIDGFSLIELLVVLVVLGALVAIAVPSYTDWLMERQLTSDTKKVLSFVQKARARAYTTKNNLELQKNGNRICDGSGACVSTEHEFALSHSTLGISSRGVYDKNGYIRIQDTSKIDKYDPKYSCVALDLVRARMGEYDASTSPKCDAE